MLKSGALRSLVCVGLGAVLGLIAASGKFHLSQRADAASPSEQQINGRSPSGLETSTATAAEPPTLKFSHVVDTDGLEFAARLCGRTDRDR